jgi:serine-type D-Ala-D-Ala carboxypeptidase/endopeptidase (penicillin-binding protein 4)
MPRILLAALLLFASACAPLRHTPAPPAARAALAVELDALLDEPRFAAAHWGVLVRSLATGETLYARNAERLFVPASALKVMTGAAALDLLGPGHRFHTEILTTGPIRDGILLGDLVVRGGGDPTLSGRFHASPREPFRAWADSLRALGIRRIGGAVVGLEGAFVDPPLGRGWAWDDLDAAYSAEVGALVFNEGAILLRIHPSRREGGAAVVITEPATGYVRIVNRVVTGAPGEDAVLSVSREPAGPGVVLSGRIPPDTVLTRTVAVREPARYFATVLRETLREAGIPVDGPIFVERDRPVGEMDTFALRPLFAHRSPPLAEILPPLLWHSVNPMAEMLLRGLGLESAGEGSAAGGNLAVGAFLEAHGLDPQNRRMVDGSGLSRYNLLSPRTLIGVLEAMHASARRDVWLEALPAAGREGTLSGRLRETPLEGLLRAKTGTLGGVRALAGYLPTAAGDTLVFAVLLNGHLHTASDADGVIDALLLRLHREPAARAGAAARAPSMAVRPAAFARRGAGGAPPQAAPPPAAAPWR